MTRVIREISCRWCICNPQFSHMSDCQNWVPIDQDDKEKLKADRPHPRDYLHTPPFKDTQTNRCYQLHYFPRFVVHNNRHLGPDSIGTLKTEFEFKVFLELLSLEGTALIVTKQVGEILMMKVHHWLQDYIHLVKSNVFLV